MPHEILGCGTPTLKDQEYLPGELWREMVFAIQKAKRGRYSK